MTLRALAACCLLTAAAASSASAQSARTLGDTLRFASTSTMVQDMPSSPMGPVRSTLESYSRTVLVLGAGDTIRMWLDSMSYVSNGPGGTQSPDMSFMLNKVFVGVLNPDGSMTMVTAPNLVPDEMAAAVSGLMPESESLFPIEQNMPDEPLRTGLVWTDTVIEQPDPDAEHKVSGRTIVRNAVVGDSVLHGLSVLIVESESDIDMTTEMSISGGMMTMNGTVKMTGKSRRFYSPAYRLYLLDTSTGSGTMSQKVDGPMPLNLSGTQTTHATVYLIR